MGAHNDTITLGGGGGVQSNSKYRNTTHKVFVFSNFILVGAASCCIFLTLTLRLIPSLSGFFLILLQLLTIAAAVSGCAASSSGRNRWYAAHMAATVITAIFQGSISVLIFSRTDEFLGALNTYVREEDGKMILKMAGGLCGVIFGLEWLALTLAFFFKYYTNFQADNNHHNSTKQDEDLKDWPWPFQV